MVILDTFLLFLPKGKIWSIGHNFKLFLECITIEIEKLKYYEQQLIKESSPFTLLKTTDEWAYNYELIRTGVESIDIGLIKMYAYATGGQSLEYLNKVVKFTYPQINVTWDEETDTIFFDGYVFLALEKLSFINITMRIIPAYLTAKYDIEVIKQEGATAVSGVMISGIGVSGRKTILERKGQ